MYKVLHALFFAIILLSSTIIVNSPSSKSAFATNSQAELRVVRSFSTQMIESSYIHIIDNQTLAKYSFLMEPMKIADKQFIDESNVKTSYCYNGVCVPVMAPPPEGLPPPTIKISLGKAKTMILDSIFGFQWDRIQKDYFTEVKVGWAIYGLSITGVSPENIPCDIGLVPIMKSSTNSIDCVKPETALKLVERGWGTIAVSSSSVQGATMNKTVFVIVKRFDGQLGKDAKINKVDSQTIMRYQGLDDAIAKADKQYYEFERILESCQCANTTYTVAGLDAPPPQFKITTDLANQMIADPAFKFRDESLLDKSSKIYDTTISYGNGTYVISISMI